MSESADHGQFARATGRIPGESAGSDKPRYRRFQHELIAPWCGHSVLEVGAGLGEFAETLTGLDRLVVTDTDQAAVELMAGRFSDRSEVRVFRMDVDVLPAIEPVDTVLALNVLEHIEDDAGMLASLGRLVTPGGNVVMWVPGYNQLYGAFDSAVGHFRRYTPASLSACFTAAGLSPVMVRPVNFLGALAWWAAVRRGGAGSPDSRLVSVYDRLVVPVTRAVERRIRPPFGQSILGVARVRDQERR